MQGSILVGISGWRYPPWRGVFYPPKLPQRLELEHASRQLPTIEINGSFYSLQRPDDYAQWRDATPPGFVFAVKGSRYITHMKRLKDVDVALANFFASGLFELQSRLGPLLWQFPPQMAFDAERFAAFFELLPRDTDAARRLAGRHDERVDGRSSLRSGRRRKLRHAVEIRHPSFDCPEFIALLRKYQIALVIADSAGRWPLLEDLTADFVYLRLHGDKELYASGYGEAALARWAARIDAWAHGRQVDDARLASPVTAPRRARRDVYCYFDNDVKVHAPFDAARLAARLGLTDGYGPLADRRPPESDARPRERAPGFPARPAARSRRGVTKPANR